MQEKTILTEFTKKKAEFCIYNDSDWLNKTNFGNLTRKAKLKDCHDSKYCVHFLHNTKYSFKLARHIVWSSRCHSSESKSWSLRLGPGDWWFRKEGWCWGFTEFSPSISWRWAVWMHLNRTCISGWLGWGSIMSFLDILRWSDTASWWFLKQEKI